MGLKKNIIFRFADLLDNEEFSNYKIILSTSTGTITGRFLKDSDSQSSSHNNETTAALAFSQLCGQEYDLYKEELNLSDSDKLPGDDGYLLLKDVEILTSVKTITLPAMVVFFSDIVGVSIGEIG